MEEHTEQQAERDGTTTPPYSDTGAQTALIDWLGVTFPDGTTLAAIYELFDLDGWVTLPKGSMGYRKGLIRGNVRILYDGSSGMGVHIEASGKGCRELEGDKIVSDWPAFLGVLKNAHGRFSRLDAALDDKSGLLDLDAIASCVDAGEVVSRYKFSDEFKRKLLQDGSVQGRTLYFGSPASDTRVRIYDKAAEQRVAGPWVRVELQSRNDRAELLAAVIVHYGFEEVSGILRGLIDFKVKGTNSQRERWDTRDWWNTFLNGVKKLRLSTAPAARSIDKSFAWCQRQVAPTLAMIIIAMGGDYEVLEKLVKDGQRRLRPHHKALLAAAAHDSP